MRKNKLPPDGGYGWVVTFAYALNNFVVLPLIGNFSIVFNRAINETGLSASQGILIITMNHGFGMIPSFFGGPVLRRFGYRKVAAFGAILVSVGLIMTAAASNFWVFLLSYSIITSTGVAAVMAAFVLAINSFFEEKRGRAIGVAMSLTGLGSIYMPVLMGELTDAFGWRYAVFILAAISLQSLVGACLLRPVKWYLRDPPTTDEEVPLKRTPSSDLINGNKTTLSSDQIGMGEEKENPISKYPTVVITEEMLERKKSFLQKFVDFFDLTLLKDPILVNILIGLSVTGCVDISFSTMFPMILTDMAFETVEIGRVTSVIGFSDTVFRLVSPFIGEWCHIPARIMFMIGIVSIVFMRTSILLFISSYKSMILLALPIGISKGLRTMNKQLIIPNHVPIERLAFASGIQTFVFGITIMILGPLLGRIRETSGSFELPILVMNVLSLFIVFLWSAEFIYVLIKNKIKSGMKKTLDSQI